MKIIREIHWYVIIYVEYHQQRHSAAELNAKRATAATVYGVPDIFTSSYDRGRVYHRGFHC